MKKREKKRKREGYLKKNEKKTEKKNLTCLIYKEGLVSNFEE